MSYCRKKMDADKENDLSDHENNEASDEEEWEESSEKSSDQEEREESSEKSSDQEEREESSEKSSGKAETKEQPISIKVLSWNINGDNQAGFGQVRSVMVANVVVLMRPDVILLQETYPINTPAFINWYTRHIGLYYKAARGEGTKKGKKLIESQVLYDSTQYTQVNEEETIFPVDSDKKKESLKAVLDRAKDEVFLATNDKLLRKGAFDQLKKVFNERISIVGLRIKESDEQPYEGPIMIFMSFHNVNTSIGADVRAIAIEGFCQLVTKLRELTGCVVLAGADLNQQFVHPIGPTRKYPYPNILDYKPTSRRLKRGQIDYFILEPADCLKGIVEPFDFEKSLKLGHCHLRWFISTPIFMKTVEEQPPAGTLYMTYIKKGIRKYKPYKLATIKDFSEMIPHDPLLCTFVVPGYVFTNA